MEARIIELVEGREYKGSVHYCPFVDELHPWFAYRGEFIDKFSSLAGALERLGEQIVKEEF
jgi:hypothetical protein